MTISAQEQEKLTTLMMVIQEEVGELQHAINQILWEEFSETEEKKYFNNAFLELQDIFAPLIELHEELRKRIRITRGDAF